MDDRVGFNGFPKEGLTFLADLKSNNNREWFQEHKHLFDEKLVLPAQAFVETIGPRLKIFSPGLRFDSSKNGRGSIMRIYRDIRFSKDKTPYNTYMRFRFWEGSDKKESPGVFIGLDEKGAGVHVGMHMFPKTFLHSYRDSVLKDELGQELADFLEKLKGVGDYGVSPPHYKRIPRGFDANHPRAELLRQKALYISSPSIKPSLLTTPDFVDVCLDHVAEMIPLHLWLLKVSKQVEG